MAYHQRHQRASSASSVLTQLADDIVEALNPANDSDASIVVDYGGASSLNPASNSNGVNKNAAGPSQKRQNAGTNGFSGDGGDEREQKRPKKELPADKNPDSEDQPGPEDKGKGKEVDPIVPVKKKRGRPPGVKNKPKFPVAPNPVINGNSATVTPQELHSARPTRPGYQPPRNPVPSPDDISDNTILISSNTQLNSSSFRMDRPLPPDVNIPERPRYLTPTPLPPLINPPGAIFPNKQEFWRDGGYSNTFGQLRHGQQEQQQRQQHPGNQPLQAAQRPCPLISPSNAGNHSPVPQQAGTIQNPVVIDEQQPPSSQRPMTNSPHPGAPNTSRADRSQAGPSRIVPPQSGAPQLKQEDQQQSMNPNSPHHGFARPPSAAPSQSSWPNTVPPNWGLPPPSGQHQQQTMHTSSPRQGIASPSPVAQSQTGQPRITPPHLGSRQLRGPSQSPRPRLAHPQPMHQQNHNTLGPFGNSHNQFHTGRRQPLPSSMPSPQGSSLGHEAFPPAHIQTHVDPSDTSPALHRIREQQKTAGAIPQAQYMMQQQSQSPRLAPHGHSRQQGEVGSPKTHAQSLHPSHFQVHHGQYHIQQPQYNTPHPSAVYIQQGYVSQNTFAIGQVQSQPHTFNQGSPVQQGTRQLPQSPQAVFTQDLRSYYPPPSPYATTQQPQRQQFHPPQIETPPLQYSKPAQNHPGFCSPPPQNQLIRQSPIQQQRVSKSLPHLCLETLQQIF